MAVATTMNARRRRVMFGANVFFSIVLAVGLLIVAVYLAGEHKAQFDWTRSGVNSLSPRTIKLVKGLDQDVTITALYTVLSEYDTLAQKRQDRVSDLLDLYESAAGSHIAARVLDPMKDQSKLQPILDRLKNKTAYKNESVPHEAVLAKLSPLVSDLQVLLQSEIDRMSGIAAQFQGDKFAVIQRNLQIIMSEAPDEREQIMALVEGELPEYGAAIQALKTYLPRVQTVLVDARTWATRVASSGKQMPPEALAFYRDAGNRYADILKRIAEMMEQSKDLQKVALENLYADLRGWARAPVILVETDAEARVLTMQDVWPQRRDPNAPVPEDGDTREFAGERAVSSAILQLTQKDKTAVVFTHWGGPSPLTPDFSQMNPAMMNLRQMPTAPYQRVNGVLKDANFVTAEWDVQKVKQPPTVPGAARVIYVVFPPTAPRPSGPNQPPPPGISPADKAVILKAVDDSGLAFFLTGWTPPSMNPMQMGATAGKYEFGDYLADKWGIDVKSGLLTISFVPSQDSEKAGLWLPRGRGASMLQTLTTPPQLRYGDQEIVKPLKTLATALAQIAPIEIMTGEKALKNGKVAPLIEVAPTPDIWAISDVRVVDNDLRTKQGTKPHPGDLPSGFPVAVAAEKTEGDKPHRLIVVGSQDFASDAIAMRTGLAQVGNGLRVVTLSPGNLELFINGLHWLAGNAERISVGPTSSEIPRLDKLEEGGMATFCRVFLVGIWPGLMLVAGGGVWLFRRR